MKHKNVKKENKLANFPQESIETVYETLRGLLSFNFRFLDDTQGQKFSDLSVEQFYKIIEKLKWYSKENRSHWEATPIGHRDGKVLAVYQDFPSKSNFFHPKYIPAGVKWARFRLEGDQRLIGFVIDKNDVEKFQLNPDVFYIVFLDLYHKFYISKK
ncbi:hypothetical protein [Treponema vincentii]|uniref:hypothetical protein n=1 Tax=Treponema vincentii TaxID=69710 RepID=UPI0020A393FB|nr:hypothetical protein [Treponema vincentii]UTC48258.1 hypothetical protein E4N73_05170 [Treponema vincentii]